jgi:hypothetical protein
VPTYRFQEVPLYAQKSVPCSGGCGKKLRSQRKFSQTLNPFNKDAEGRPKTSLQIYAELSAQAQEWKTAAEMCAACSSA